MVKIRSLRPQKSWPGCLHKGKRMMVEMIRRDGLKLKEALTV
jgi:hypothetical protein